MSDAQAGTPAVAPENRDAGQEKPPADGSGLNAQQQKEFLIHKQKAEDYNRLEAEKKALEARLEQMERVAYGQGAGQATDPEAADIAALREQAAYDPAARATLRTMEIAARTQLDLELDEATAEVPGTKRAQVKALIRNSMYRMSVKDALRLVTDPEAATTKQRLAELEAENERLRTAKPHGSSPAATTPAGDAGEQRQTIKRSEYIAILNQGGQRAKDLMQAVGNNKTKLEND